MKVLPIYQCPGCKRFLEFTLKDVRVLTFGQRYELDCTVCNRTTHLPVGQYNFLFPETEEEEEAPPPPARKTNRPERADLEAEAIEVYTAYQGCGENLAATAKKLKMTQKKIKEILQYLPETVSGRVV